MKGLFFVTITILSISFSARADSIKVGDLVSATRDYESSNDLEYEFDPPKICSVQSIHGDNATIACHEYRDHDQGQGKSCRIDVYSRPLSTLHHPQLLTELYGVKKGTLILGEIGETPYKVEAFVLDYAVFAYDWSTSTMDSTGCWRWFQERLDFAPIRTVDFPATGPQLGASVWVGDTLTEVTGVTDRYEVDNTSPDGSAPKFPITQPLESFPKEPGPIYVTKSGLSARWDDIYYWESKELEDESILKVGDFWINDEDEVGQVSKILWNCYPSFGVLGDPGDIESCQYGYRGLYINTNGTAGFDSDGYKEFYSSSKNLPVKSGDGIDDDGVVRKFKPGMEKIAAVSDSDLYTAQTDVIEEKYFDLTSDIGGSNSYAVVITENFRRYFIFVCDDEDVTEDSTTIHPQIKELCRPSTPNGPKPRDIFAIEF